MTLRGKNITIDVTKTSRFHYICRTQISTNSEIPFGFWFIGNDNDEDVNRRSGISVINRSMKKINNNFILPWRMLNNLHIQVVSLQASAKLHKNYFQKRDLGGKKLTTWETLLQLLGTSSSSLSSSSSSDVVDHHNNDQILPFPRLGR